MSYDEILQRIDGEGIQPYNQGEEAIKAHLNISDGICRALAVMWLRSKKDNSDFWVKTTGTVAEPLLAAINRLESAVDLQAEYAKAVQSKFIPDSATMAELQKSGLKYNQDDITASAQEGFAQELPNDEPVKIAKQVFLTGSRFFILSIWGVHDGVEIGHSIGIHRPYSLVGKSSDAYVFDPNIGEFKVTGQQNLRSLLIEINTIVYVNGGIDLNQKYMLWSYST